MRAGTRVASVVLLAWLGHDALGGVAHAHGTRSVSVEITEVSPGNATLQIRAQLPGDVVRVTVDPPCTGHPLGADAASVVSTMRVECPVAIAGATLRFAGLGPIVNQAIVFYALAEGRTGSAVVRMDEPRLQLPRVASTIDVAKSYVGLGIAHILTGYDHLLFLLLLVLCLRNVRAVMLAELAFTLSHSISFSATALGFVHVSSGAAEACIALSLVLMALDVRPGEPRPARRGAFVAFVFGLVHGLGFAGGLSEIGLPDQDVAVALIGFASGVELGQLLFLTAVLLAMAGLARMKHVLRMPRLEPLAIAVVGGLSTYWLAERLVSVFAHST